ncbi:Xenobiotic-transporting ATPase [[Synechococcus] sp. NIES-970]|uniref:ABC transporter ATP-binding protein n=1 Tax=Picosynechococcus sp. NKBG15041c TaxID=1407650 RepID=UPI00041A5C09|nr:ABC transporter ATP-binding protein [Picosynechococcus sp. NKBG15041c]BAW96824.1 Xenobiotic-transporting ATPase [[Synechococcus] sp. NIES-970]
MKLPSALLFVSTQFPKELTQTVVFSTIASLLEGVSLAIIVPLLQILVEGSLESDGNNESKSVSLLFSFFGQFSPQNQLLAIGICFFILVLIKGVFLFLGNHRLRVLSVKVSTELRQRCLDRFLNLPVSAYDKLNTGTLSSYTNEQAQRCEQLTLNVGITFNQFLTVTSLFVLLISLSWQLSGIAIFCISIIAFFLQSIIRGVRREARRVAQSISEFSASISELLSGIRIVKAYSAERIESAKILKILDERLQSEVRSSIGQSLVMPLSDISGVLMIFVILFLANQLFLSDASTSVSLAFLIVLVRMVPRINSLNNLRATTANYAGSFNVIETFFEETEGLQMSNGNILFEGLSKGITFENINFAYQSNSGKVLENFNLFIPKGRVTALVGASGSGKSTIASLIMGFYQPQAGAILFDSHNLRDLDTDSLRAKIAYVSQESFIFNCSVYENILYGNWSASHSEVIEAATKAYASEFIDRLPQGYETVLGERGVNLSGGQRQRLAIARAIVRNPDILILDESTSALDSASEKMIQQAIDSFSHDRTVIVIAHRLSTIESADNIVVLDKGKIVEQGKHLALLNSSGYYSKLHLGQPS